MIHRSCCLLTGLVVVACGASIAAAAPDSNPNVESYGRGVQAYFSGDFAAAESLFAQAIGHDPKDPRPSYFRALSLLRQGRNDEARSDFLIAATLEARSRGSYPVGQSLERVQGADRLILEQYRWQVRASDTQAFANGVPSGASHPASLAMHTDAGALRQPVSVPLDRLVEPVSLSELVEASTVETASTNPFADDPNSAPEKSISSGKLLGIVGRALLQSAPVPQIDGLKERLPGLPRPAASAPAPVADADFGSATQADPATDDPFSEPAPPAAEPSQSDPPAESVEEDPFG